MRIQDLSPLLSGAAEAFRAALSTKQKESLRSLGAFLRDFPENAETMDEISRVFDALSAIQEPLVRKKQRESYGKLASLLRRFSGQSVTSFIETIEKLIDESRNSLPALIERSRAIRSGSTQESPDEVLAAAKNLKVKDLKSLIEALTGQKPKGSKEQLLERLHRLLTGYSSESSESVCVEPDDDALVDEVVAQYESLRTRLRQMSYEELDECMQRFASYRSAVLEKALNRLGFPREETKAKMIATLRNTLVSIKSSQQQVALIP